MGDQWLVRQDDEGDPLYLLESDPIPVWVQFPRDAAVFTNARARAIVRTLNALGQLKVVRRYEEIRRRFVEDGVPQ